MKVFNEIGLTEGKENDLINEISPRGMFSITLVLLTQSSWNGQHKHRFIS